jgi:hypothetical protein
MNVNKVEYRTNNFIWGLNIGIYRFSPFISLAFEFEDKGKFTNLLFCCLLFLLNLSSFLVPNTTMAQHILRRLLPLPSRDDSVFLQEYPDIL